MVSDGSASEIFLDSYNFKVYDKTKFLQRKAFLIPMV